MGNLACLRHSEWGQESWQEVLETSMPWIHSGALLCVGTRKCGDRSHGFKTPGVGVRSLDPSAIPLHDSVSSQSKFSHCDEEV